MFLIHFTSLEAGPLLCLFVDFLIDFFVVTVGSHGDVGRPRKENVGTGLPNPGMRQPEQDGAEGTGDGSGSVSDYTSRESQSY